MFTFHASTAFKTGKRNVNVKALSRNPVEQICIIQPSFTQVKECSDDESARIQNANPQPLKLSPQRGSMRKELEPECTEVQTRRATLTNRKSIPFTRKELQELSFLQHTVQADAHHNSTENSSDNSSINNNSFNLQNLFSEEEKNADYLSPQRNGKQTRQFYH